MKKIGFLLVGFALLALSPVGNKYKGPKNFVFVPSNKVMVHNQEMAHKAFFMLNHEITNLEYYEFLYDLKANSNLTDYNLAYPDTSAWNMPGTYNQPMVDYYFRHPAYRDYPVVNVSRKGMELYCAWLTTKLKSRYGDHINVLRLPTKCEWISAACGGNENTFYAWGSSGLYDKEGKPYANFTPIGDQNIRRTENGFEIVQDSTFLLESVNAYNYQLTAPSQSYSPNPYGLYNMSGNVAELTSDGVAMGGHWGSTGYDIRITSQIDFEKANPFVGFRPVMTYITLKP